MKALLIARVSTDDQADALPAQLYRLKDYAERHEMDYEVFEVQESAFKGDRLQFRKLLTNIRKQKQEIAIVFDKVDRLSRDPSSEILRSLKELVEHDKITLHFCSDHLTLNKRSSASEWMMFDMATASSSYYSRAISDNVRRRNEQLHRDGIWTARAPFGYINTELDGKKWIVPHPLLADALKDAFTMYATGSTLSLIKDHWFVKYGYNAGLSLVAKVLHNDFYIGVMHTSNGTFNHSYEQLVTQVQFNAVAARLSGYKAAPRKYASLPFPYRGIVTCSLCGCRITFERKKNRYTYGHCTQYRGKHQAAYVNETIFTKQFAAALESIRISEDVATKVIAELRADARVSDAERKRVLTKLKSDAKKVEARITGLYEHLADGVISEAVYKRKQLEYEQEIEKITNRQKTFELSHKVDVDSVSNLLKFANKAKDTFLKASNDEKRELLEVVLSNSQLDGDSLLLKMKKPFEMMAFCNDNSTWQGHVESNHDPRFWRPIY